MCITVSSDERDFVTFLAEELFEEKAYCIGLIPSTPEQHRFPLSPKSGHYLANMECPLGANSRHRCSSKQLIAATALMVQIEFGRVDARIGPKADT
jgi:hypothetical protein